MPRWQALANVMLFGFGIAYPAIVFFLQGSVDPLLFIVLALTIVALRLAMGKAGIGGWRPALLVAAVVLAGLALIDAALAARAYPVLISVAAASVFAATLWRPPSLIERLALAGGEPWSPALRDYCRTVTLMWALWLSVNAAIAAMLAVADDDAAWALWTGLLSYLVSGMLFAGEWLVRRTLPGRQAR
ncbi:hypothetical protein BH11PSE3_BH11PSE3_34510 [soil metagenome]